MRRRNTDLSLTDLPTLPCWDGSLTDSVRKDGAIVTLDEHETTFAKLQFAGASVKSYRMNYDSRVKKGVVTIIVIEAKEIATDNDLFFTNK